MASKHFCICGAIVRTNLFEGHSLSLLIPEEATARTDFESEAAGSLADRLLQESKLVARCTNCGTLSVVDKNYGVRFFKPVEEAVASADT
jgi:hypothetical protein